METEGQLWELKAKVFNFTNSAFVYKGTQLVPLLLFSVLLPFPSLSIGVPQFTPGNRAWDLALPDRAGQTYPGIAAMPWQIMVSTKVNLSGWLVTTAWDCECSQKDHFKIDNCFVLSLYFLRLAGVSFCLLLLPWPIRGLCSAQMGSSKNLLSDLVFPKHMYTKSFLRLTTRPNVGAFSQEQQITYLITRKFSLSSCKSTLKQVQ